MSVVLIRARLLCFWHSRVVLLCAIRRVNYV